MNTTFHEEQNTELIRLFTKIDATDIPPKFAKQVSEIITMLLMTGKANNQAEYQQLDMIHNQLTAPPKTKQNSTIKTELCPADVPPLSKRASLPVVGTLTCSYNGAGEGVPPLDPCDAGELTAVWQ